MEEDNLHHSQFQGEGTLSVDVYYKDDELVIISPIAGTSLDNIDVFIEGDILIIKGRRTPPEEIPESAYEYRECFWGPFSRTIALPKKLDLTQTRAFYHNGVLMIKIPKTTESKMRRIEIRTDL
ncbi:MAG: Hsp20/alpha crystallin family protein [Patescibacteria group bacterium]|nr:Hsp20/alpha crystallin family protein [Patescibacteria group bacterium]